MANKNNDGLFLKVSIENIKAGEVARIGLQKFGLLVVLGSFANDKGECFPSQSLLAELCGVGRTRINIIIKELCEYRTEDGRAILSKTTNRKALNKTTTNYKFHSASGVAFGKNKVITKTIQHQESTGVVTKSNKVVTETIQRLYRKDDKGCIENDTLTKAIELEPINNNHIEQEKETSASFQEKETSAKANKDNNIVAINKTKDSTTKEKLDTIVEGVQETNVTKVKKRISHSIVVNGRRKENEGCTWGGTGDSHVVQAEVKETFTNDSQDAAQRSTDDPHAVHTERHTPFTCSSKPRKLSQHEITLLAVERNRKASIDNAAAAEEERRKQAIESEKRRKAHRSAQDVISGSGVSCSERISKHLESTNMQRESVSFEKLLEMSESEIKAAGILN